jgi:hypothetical protein
MTIRYFSAVSSLFSKLLSKTTTDFMPLVLSTPELMGSREQRQRTRRYGDGFAYAKTKTENEGINASGTAAGLSGW